MGSHPKDMIPAEGLLRYMLSLLLTPSSLLAIFVTYWTLWVVYARFFHPLSKIPGPFAASISRGWIGFRVFQGDLDRVQRACHNKYGPLVRIAPDQVSCADGEAIKTIYNVKDPWQKSDYYSAWHNKEVNPVADLFSGRDEKLHGARRKNVNNVYSMTNVLRSEQYIDKCSELFIQRMGEYADARETVDLGEWLQWYAFDVIGEIFFGRMFGFMEGRHDHANYIHSLDTLLPALTFSATSVPYARPFILGSAVLSPAARKALKAINRMADAARASVAQRFEDEAAGKDTREDILAQFMKIYHDKGEARDFTVRDMEQECYTAFLAGSDTTAIAMRAIFYFLMKNPSTYQTLLKELDDAAAAGKLSNPVKYAESIKLPYFCACIREAMRLHPSVGFPMPRIVPKGGFVACGEFIPEGYSIGVNGAVVQYDKTMFGKDSYEFKPSRWLERDAKAMDRYMVEFGAGTRTCIGKNISLSEIHKLVPQFLRHFSIELADPDREWKTMSHPFNQQTGILVNITRRQRS